MSRYFEFYTTTIWVQWCSQNWVASSLVPDIYPKAIKWTQVLLGTVRLSPHLRHSCGDSRDSTVRHKATILTLPHTTKMSLISLGDKENWSSYGKRKKGIPGHHILSHVGYYQVTSVEGECRANLSASFLWHESKLYLSIRIETLCWRKITHEPQGRQWFDTMMLKVKSAQHEMPQRWQQD